MENIRKFVVALLMISLCTGCVNLSEDLTGQSTSDKFFKTIVDFNSYISGAYTPLINLYGEDAPYIACSGGEDINTSVIRWKGFEQVNINSVGNPEEVTDILWNYCYSSISQCNTTIELIAKNTYLSPEELLPIDGEARFLRAFGYFQLVRWFGEIPLLTEKNQKNAAVEPQVAVATIYAQIVADLQSAEKMLPEKREDRSRPTSWTAKALLAKVYLAMAGYPIDDTSYYTLARDKAWEVINEKVYKLEPDFFNLWLHANSQSNTEFIFALYGNSISKTGGYQARAVRPENNGEGGWADWHSDKRFLDMFPVGDNSRLKGTFYLTMIDGTPWDQTNIQQPYVGKLRDAGPASGGYYGAPVGSGDGFYCMLRYADLLLIYAEAANQAEGSPSQKAYDAINDVRSRAGLDNLSGLTPKQFDEAVLNERNWELAFECNRWFDLCRRRILKEKLTSWYPDSNIDDHNYLLPKPSDQLMIMTGVQQNPGY